MVDKKKEEEKRVARVMASAMMGIVLEESWSTLVENNIKVKEQRIGRATLSTLTARTKNWTISITSSPKRKRDRDWHNLGTPQKNLGGEGVK